MRAQGMGGTCLVTRLLSLTDSNQVSWRYICGLIFLASLRCRILEHSSFKCCGRVDSCHLPNKHFVARFAGSLQGCSLHLQQFRCGIDFMINCLAAITSPQAWLLPADRHNMLML